MRTRRQNRVVQLRSQHGVALVVSLVLLVSMTIIGIATLSGTRLNEQIVSNSQQKSIAFEAAESALESVTNYTDLYTAITSDPNAAVNNPDAVVLADTESRLNTGYDLGKGGQVAVATSPLAVDIEGRLTVQYCGEVQPIGTSLSADLDSGQFTAILVDVNSVANVANSGARADHIRRVLFQVPQTGRTGNCPPP